jgi:hypothetical protein
VRRVAVHGSGAALPGLVEVGRTAGDARVYEVAPAERPSVAVLSGAGLLEHAGFDAFRWVADDGRIDVVSDAPGDYTVHLSASAPPGQTRTLVVDGKSLGRVDDAAVPFSFCVRTRPTGDGVARHRVPIGTREPMAPLGPGDPRQVTVAVHGLHTSEGCSPS